ncbi:hypothetical protein K492DRAFT_205683 [Lichtheimia hyalospora FSU 10163]|nr:hypothetical protein K492DRAFT_205683 [Lichtheimia hyalospora FSU 10163]
MAVLLQPQRSKQTRTLLAGAILSCIVLLATSYFAWTSSHVRPNDKAPSNHHDAEIDTVQYPDVSEQLDQDTLTSLLLSASSSSSYERQHTWAQLNQLVDNVDATSLPGVTAIVLYNKEVAMQIKAITQQPASVAPVAVWIICTTEDERRIVEQQNLPKGVQVLVRDKSSWLPVPATDYVWLVDKGVVPGSRYLDFLLKLAHTNEYKNTLLGSTSITLVQNQDGSIACKAIEQQQQTHSAQTIHYTWLLRRHWLAALMKEDGIPPAENNALGYWISFSINKYAGIPLIGLPTTNDAEYRVEQHDGNDDCTAFNNYLAQHPKALAGQQIPLENQDEQQDAVIFFVSDTSPEWMQLACDMHQHQDNNAAVHIVTTNNNDIQCPSLPLSRIHHVDMGSTDLDTSDLVQQLMQIIRVTQSKLLFYMQPSASTAVQYALEYTKSLLVDGSTTMIGLPTQSLQHVSWITELPVETLSKWHDFTLKIILTTEKHHAESFMHLFESVHSAEYLGDRVDLMLYMESSSDARTQTTVQGVQWEHGLRDIRHRIVPTERASMFVEAWYPSTNNEYAIILDDGMRLSPLFYIWAKYAILKYRYTATNRNDHLYGISLTAPRILDTAADSDRQLFEAPSDNKAYLMQVAPSLGAAVYFPEHWREFHDYMNARVADHLDKQLQHIQIPNLRSSQWIHSWRRYMDELVYLRGNVMLYPNLDSGASFATRLELSTDHAHPTPVSMVQLYTLPLVEKDATGLFAKQLLSDWSNLKALDMWGQPATLTELADRGKTLQKQVSACILGPEYNFDPSELLCPFARVVEYKGGSKETLPTRTITLYVPAETHP